MGIPFYFSYLIKNHPDIMYKLNTIQNVNNLFIDANSIIYDSLDFKQFTNTNEFETIIIQNVIQKINNIVKLVNPNTIVYIAFDGIPPLGKLNQQKNRRYKNHIQSAILNKEIIWDTANITPGTNFMKQLNIKLTQFYNNIKSNINSNIKYILSLSDIPGEGEHKLFEYIRNNVTHNDNNVIYGMDADLIMLSLNHIKICKQIYLYRETPHFIQSIDNNFNPEENYIIDIFKLANQIYKELVFTDDINNVKNNLDNLCLNDEPNWLIEASIDISLNNNNNNNNNIFTSKISDYIFICFLLGNDFLPHFPAINIRTNGFTIILELYKKLFNKNKNIIENNIINWNNFKLFIKEIATNEENFIKSNYAIKNKWSKKTYLETDEKLKEKKYNEMPCWERNIELFINPYENHWQFRYYLSLFHTNIDQHPEYVSNVCTNYLKTLQWTINYYSDNCTNWQHYYQYHYPPLLSDLYKNIPYFNSELILEENYNNINYNLLLAYVLPKKSLKILQNDIFVHLLNRYPEFYKEDYEVVYAFCKYFWEGHVEFPKIDLTNLSNIIKFNN